MTKRDIKFRYKGLYAYISKQYPSNDFTCKDLIIAKSSINTLKIKNFK